MARSSNSPRTPSSSTIQRAIEWEILPETFANPIHRIRLPKRWLVREKRIHTPEDSARILALLDEPNLLICETCLDTGTRISEVTGLMIKHVDLENGTIHIQQRNWRGDIHDPKNEQQQADARPRLVDRALQGLDRGTEAEEPERLGLPTSGRPQAAALELGRPPSPQEGCAVDQAE